MKWFQICKIKPELWCEMGKWGNFWLILSLMTTSRGRDGFTVGAKNHQGRNLKKQHSNYKDQHLIEKSVPTGQLEYCGDVTEVVDEVRTTKWQREGLTRQSYPDWNSTDPRTSHSQLDSDLVVSNYRILQNMTNGHVAVIGYHCQEKAFWVSKHKNKTYFSSTVQENNISFQSPKFYEYSRQSYRYITDFPEGQITGKKNTLKFAKPGQVSSWE